MRGTIYVVRSFDLANPQRAPRWHGRDDSVAGMTVVGAPTPVGLRGWRFWGDAQRAVDMHADLYGTVLGVSRRYEVVKMGPPEGGHRG